MSQRQGHGAPGKNRGKSKGKGGCFVALRNWARAQIRVPNGAEEKISSFFSGDSGGDLAQNTRTLKSRAV